MEVRRGLERDEEWIPVGMENEGQEEVSSISSSTTQTAKTTLV